MPKSKRAKVVSLTQTKKKDREWKSSLIDRVRDALESRSACYVFKYENMRNGTFKEMRAATEETTMTTGATCTATAARMMKRRKRRRS